MRTDSRKNIILQQPVYKKNRQQSKNNIINIKTIGKLQNSFSFPNNNLKKYFSDKEIWNVQDTTKENDYSSNNNYSRDSNTKKDITINSLNSSYNSTYTSKKWKYKRQNKKSDIVKNKIYSKKRNFIAENLSDSFDSLNIINSPKKSNRKYRTLSYKSSLSQITQSDLNKNISYSSNESNYNDSDSSDSSFNSIKNYKKNLYYSKMLKEENEFDYLSRKDVGLFSSEDESNNTDNNSTNNKTNNNSFEENLSEEIERILIEIYNKNISLISSYNEEKSLNKKYVESDINEKQIMNYFKKQNDSIKLIALKILSNKIKELIEKYKEKIYEISEIRKLYDINMFKMKYVLDKNKKYSKSIGSSGLATNSNSSSYGSDEDNLYFKKCLVSN